MYVSCIVNATLRKCGSDSASQRVTGCLHDVACRHGHFHTDHTNALDWSLCVIQAREGVCVCVARAREKACAPVTCIIVVSIWC